MKCDVDGGRMPGVSLLWVLCLLCLCPVIEGAVVTNLVCEGLVNPVGMDAVRPLLSWQMVSERRADRQTAYQVLVASKLSILEEGRGDIWDSGRQRGDESILIPFAGRDLAPVSRYVWKVRVWDVEGKASAWSRPAQWLTGILDPRDWEASWIGAGKGPALEPEAGWQQKQSSPLFRRSFEIKRPVASAVLCLSGLGYYEGRLNGKRIGSRVLDPALTRYDRRVLYSTYDVTALLQEGENILGVMLGNGWYNLHTQAVWGFNRAPWRDRPKLIAQLHLRYRDGGTQVIHSGKDWKATFGPLVRDGVRHGEVYDARRELPGWDAPGYDDRKWAVVETVAPPGGTLRAQMLPPCRVTATLRPVEVTRPRPGTCVVDMGQNFAGWVQLTVRGEAGTRITLRYGERLAPDGTLDQRDLSTLVESGPFQTDVYILGGGKEETWSPRFAYHGFRYIQVEGYPGRLTAEKILGCVVHTDFGTAGTFACSSDQLNRTQSQVLWSYRSNFHGYPTDCPHREKNGWLGSAHLAAEQAMFNFHNAPGYRKWLQDLRDEQREDGALPAIVPTSGWGYQRGSGPAAGSASVVIPWLLYVYRGDRQVLEDCYAMMKRYVDSLSARADSGIVDFGKEDMSSPGARTPRALTSTAYYHADVLTLSRVARILGKDADATSYEQLARSVRAAFRKKFIGSDGHVQPTTLTALACVLEHGLAGDDERKPFADRLADVLIRGRWQMDAGVLGGRALLRALSDHGQHRAAYWAATQPRMPGYGYWVEQGASTLWEHWSGKGSQNHIMFGDISAWFYRSLAGIRPDPARPGFRHFFVKPQLVPELVWVRAEHESPYGLVHSSWRRRDRDVVVQVQVPVNARATVHLPLLGGGEIMESGVKAEQAAGVTPGKREAGVAVYGLASGRYRFIIPLPAEPVE